MGEISVLLFDIQGLAFLIQNVGDVSILSYNFGMNVLAS